MTIKTDFANGGIEIEHETNCLSAVMEGGGITIDIGEDWYGADHPETGKHQGFQEYSFINLTLVETKVLRDWLSDRILDLMLEQAASNKDNNKKGV